MDPLEQALRTLIADLDYDIHKSIECDEDHGDNHYPELTEWFREVLAPYRNEILDQAAEAVADVADSARECDGTYPEEWSSRDVRDALYTACAEIYTLKGAT